MNKTKKPVEQEQKEETSYLEKNRSHKKKTQKKQFKGQKMNRNEYRYN